MASNEEYGYWESRTKDGVDFEPIRATAVKRLATSRRVAKMLPDKLEEDRAWQRVAKFPYPSVVPSAPH
ncbi:MAG TPA: hypothetical protein VHX86_05775 [Tepidisphaeraceae bacterium]|nr:hypothetical protein [Tepidisphaeraceae bacterium]